MACCSGRHAAAVAVDAAGTDADAAGGSRLGGLSMPPVCFFLLLGCLLLLVVLADPDPDDVDDVGSTARSACWMDAAAAVGLR